MSNTYTYLLTLNAFVQSITIVLVLDIFILLMYLICFSIKSNSAFIKDKNIIGLKSLVDSVGLEKSIFVLRFIGYFFSGILGLITIYMYLYFDLNSDLIDNIKQSLGYHHHHSFSADWLVTAKGSDKSIRVEVFHEDLGILGALIVNLYRTLYVLYNSPFPAVFKVFLGSILGIFIRRFSSTIIDLFGTKNKGILTNDYNLEGLFYQYNLCLNIMVITVILALILLIIEYYLNAYIIKINKNKKPIILLKAEETNSFWYLELAKISLLNLKSCIIYYKLDILLVLVKLVAILNIFAYTNSVVFLAFHPFYGVLVDPTLLEPLLAKLEKHNN